MNDKQNGFVSALQQSASNKQQLSSFGQNAAIEHAAMPIFREYCDVKAEFDENCRSLSAYQQRKAVSEKRLSELSAKIQAMVEDGQYDPTVPRAAESTASQASYQRSAY